MIYDAQIKNLVSNLKHVMIMDKDQDRDILTINLVLEGGGFNGLYEYGSLLLLREMERQNLIRINKISGASIGGLLAFLYLTDLLDEYITVYEDVREYWKEHNNLSVVKDKVHHLIEKLNTPISGDQYTEEDLLSRFNKRFYLSYYDIERRQQIVQSDYTSLEDVKNALLRTSHIPLVVSDQFCENSHYIDGGYPHIFSQREMNGREKTMYISISHYEKLYNTFQVREQNSSARILEGILKCYELFYANRNNSMCSFVSHWSYKDYFLLRLKQLLILIVVHTLSFFHKIYIAFENPEQHLLLSRDQTSTTDATITDRYLHYLVKSIHFIKETQFTNQLMHILYEGYRDLILSYCF
jgi:hypothetical protein